MPDMNHVPGIPAKFSRLIIWISCLRTVDESREISHIGSINCMLFTLVDSLILISSKHARKGPDLGSVAYYSAVPL